MATSKTAAKKTYPTKSGKRSATPPSKRWSGKVTTDSTKPAPGLFKKSGKAIAEGLAKKSVSPEGPGQAVRMLNFYENRGGKNLPAERKSALETAKKLLHKKVEAKGGMKSPAKKSAAKKSAAKKSAAKKTSAKKASKKSS
jgi:RNA polymerase primary sigma factor